MTSTTLDSVWDGSWDCVVLAGGQSSRMGQDKALFQWQDRLLYQHMAAIAEQSGAHRVWINRFADGSPESSQWLQDILPGRGPLSGIHAALQATDAKALIIIPVDMPLLKSEHLTQLAAHYDGTKPVEYSNYSLPLLLPVNKTTRQAVEQAINSDNRQDYALWRLLDRLGRIRLAEPVDHVRAFANTNTPAEWQAACQFRVGEPTD